MITPYPYLICKLEEKKQTDRQPERGECPYILTCVTLLLLRPGQPVSDRWMSTVPYRGIEDVWQQRVPTWVRLLQALLGKHFPLFEIAPNPVGRVVGSQQFYWTCRSIYHAYCVSSISKTLSLSSLEDKRWLRRMLRETTNVINTIGGSTHNLITYIFQLQS